MGIKQIKQQLEILKRQSPFLTEKKKLEDVLKKGKFSLENAHCFMCLNAKPAWRWDGNHKMIIHCPHREEELSELQGERCDYFTYSLLKETMLTKVTGRESDDVSKTV